MFWTLLFIVLKTTNTVTWSCGWIVLAYLLDVGSRPNKED